MPIISNEPPDPPFYELCNLTKVTSAEDLCAASFNDMKVKVMKVKHRKPFRGVKVSTPGSACAGSVLRRLRSAKSSRKARDRNKDSPGDNRCGKRVVSTSMDDEINKVLSNVSNDGSFINSPLDNSGLNDLGSPVAKSYGLQTSFDHTGMGMDMAGSRTLNEHVSMENVVNIGGVCSSSQDGIASYKVGRGFVFGKKENSKGILNPPVGPFFNVSFSNIASGNPLRNLLLLMVVLGIWMGGSEEISLKMEYVPSSICKLENGNRRISFSAEEVYKGGQACSLQLYGYFVGTSMDFRVVRGNLIRMWRIHAIEDITKANSGVYYFKFKSEDGMKRVLESGPWMIQNVPLVLNPLLMDKMTRERCLKKAGKIYFARFLVEVSAEDYLQNVLEIEYPPLGNKPARVGKLEVKYQWRRPLCSFCKTFGHSTLSCKVRPRTDEEIAAKTLKDVLNVRKSNVMDKGKSVTDDDGFTVVGKKNKPAASLFMDQAKVGGHNRWSGRGLNNMKQGYGNSGSGNSNFYGQRRVGGYVHRHQYQQKSNSNAGNVKFGRNFNNTSKSSVQKEKKKSIVDKPILASVFNHNYRPKGENVEDLGDINVNEEFESKVWPDLKEEVDILLEAGIYPSKQDPGFFCSFVYACVRTVDRRSLWKSLSIHKNFVKDKPWTILGDFNVCLDPAEGSTGGLKFTTAMHDFRNCVKEIEVDDIAMTGLNFTWNKKPGKYGGLIKKLDRVLGNSHFMSIFPLSYSLFLLYMLSDHTPAMNVWNSKIDGLSMFSLVSKLKLLKKPLRKLNFEQGNLFENVVCLKAELAGVQSSLSADPHNKALREEELRVLKAYRAALKDEKLFLRQKAKVEWLRAGDSNSSYFHNVVKGDQFVNHFKNVLGQSLEVLPFSNLDSLFMKKLPAVEALKLVKIVSNEEIKLALFDIDGNKAPGPDEINATVISLVPKVAAPSKVSDYRPIACYIVVYKIISKVI
nr:hypothetical protein [Tanacetum cinerariifolium]